MKFKKLDITFKSKKIQSKDILAVYEYGDYLIAKFQFYTSKLSYNFDKINMVALKKLGEFLTKKLMNNIQLKIKEKIVKM